MLCSIIFLVSFHLILLCSVLHKIHACNPTVIRTFQDEIKKRIREDPSLIGEEARDGDLYSSIFPKEKKGRPSGLGLLVGGVASERLAEVEAELHAAKEENMELRHVVHTLVVNQTSIMAKS